MYPPRAAADALVAISSYLRSTCFADEPDYELLRECIASLPCTSAPAQRAPAALPNGHATPPPPLPQDTPGHAWPHTAPVSAAPPPMYANGTAHTTAHAMPAGYAQMAYAQMPSQGYYNWPYQPLHSGHGHPMPLSHMQAYAGAAPQQQPHAPPITLAAPQLPRQLASANGRVSQQHAAPVPASAPAAGGASAASSLTAEFDADGQLGQIGSAFDDDEDFGQAARPHSHSRAAKRPLTADQDPPHDLHASKRVRFSPAVGVRLLGGATPTLVEPSEYRTATKDVHGNGHLDAAQRLAQVVQGKDPLVRRARGASVGAVADMERRAAVVARGALSDKGKEVKEKLRKLEPGEGVSILAWLLDSLSRNVDREATPQV